MGRSSSPVGYGIGIAEVVGSNPTRSTINLYYNSREFMCSQVLTNSQRSCYLREPIMYLFIG